MSKTLLYRAFGIGKIPSKIRPDIEREGIVMIEEGIGGTVRFKNFRAPGKRYSHKISWFSGSIVLTNERLWAFVYSNPIVSIPLKDAAFKELQFSLINLNTLSISFDPAVFDENSSGSVECRFSTDKAALFIERLKARSN